MQEGGFVRGEGWFSCRDGGSGDGCYGEEEGMRRAFGYGCG